MSKKISTTQIILKLAAPGCEISNFFLKQLKQIANMAGHSERC